MAKAHVRSQSPSSDQTPLIKRLKTAHAPISVEDVTVNFAPDVLDHQNIARLNKEYAESEPFRYALVEKLFQDDLLRNVKDECMSELNFTTKETDIYKVNQTGDLASLNYLSESQISLLPNLLKLRDALYSPQFRTFLRAVTGCGPLSGIKQDMSVNSYTKGCHLLNHDDVIGTRRVSYILYMPLPHYQVWPPAWGGALELYPVKPGQDGTLEPECVPAKSIPPSWDQFIFFEVQPGRSFHSVEEVVVGGEGEDGRARLSISGWFHAAQEGEEGYEPLKEPDLKSSRDQLAESRTNFKSYGTSGSAEDAPPLPDMEFSEEHRTFLSEWLNPVYLQPNTMKALAGRFVDESSLELHSFLSNDLAQALDSRLRDLDIRDGLGPDREGRVPPHSAGVDLPTGTSNGVANLNGSTVNVNGTKRTASAWTLKGPPHKWRYCTLLPPSPSAPATSITPLSAHPSPSEILRVLQDELFPSQAFRAWLAIVTRLLPLRHSVEARRFRPGLDYTLATSEEKEARLDVVLGLTPEVKDPETDAEVNGSGRRRAGRDKPAVRGWGAAEWGGWECYMAPHNEEDDPAVYRAGTYKKSDALANGKPKATENGHTNGSTPVNGKHASNGGSPNGKNKSPSPSHSEDADGDVEIPDAEEEDEEDDSTLLTVQPGFNRLLLVLRDERVMRFVKYVSAAAEGSRWDVCAEYEVGMMQEDDDDEDGADA
ncbi:putative component of NuA3 histone acetyltransferase complex [Paramarasmius palmivorus]|uniref:uS12 prolyl 3,4-dihydroxylase n=1 Tax=Paramarasmius palmivorus TaxID=297713 RepID=A0AAW0C3Q1_9AGAR